MKLFPRLALAAALSAAAPVASHAQQTQVFAADERFFQEGLELFDRGQYGAAQEAFRQYLALEPVHTSQASPISADRTADAEYYYAVSGLYLLHPDAEGSILAFAENHPAHPRSAVAYFEPGQVLLRPEKLRVGHSLPREGGARQPHQRPARRVGL
ncbi:hypothetical protein ACFQT0_17020 [Hymenobacter humi]|uniref:Tetratricopeptide repeat protein n=1 Tax=Hymenobacter humi TaxID=1411620 RepID=A0ABW2U9S5_9BACT